MSDSDSLKPNPLSVLGGQQDEDDTNENDTSQSGPSNCEDSSDSKSSSSGSDESQDQNSEQEDSEAENSQDSDGNEKEERKKIKGKTGSKACDGIIKKLNKIDKSWKKIYAPIRKARQRTQKHQGLLKVKGAKLEHSMEGMLLLLVAQQNFKHKDKLIQDIEINLTQEPHFDIKGQSGKQLDMIGGVAAWVDSYVKGAKAIVKIKEELETIPDEAATMLTKLEAELTQNLLNTAGLVKIKNDIVKTVTTINKVVASISKETTKILKAMNDLKTACEVVTSKINDGTIFNQGQQCQLNAKNTVQECWEFANGMKIPLPKGVKPTNSGCKCVIF